MRRVQYLPVKKAPSPVQKAYQQGYQAGYIAGTREPSVKVINEDIRFIYGGMCLALKELFGFGPERLNRTVEKIQEIWSLESEENRKNMERDVQIKREKFIDRVQRVTGVDIVQTFDLGLVDEDGEM